MRRNTPLFILAASGFIAVAGLILWVNQDCLGVGGSLVCTRTYGDLGAALAALGGLFALVGVVLEALVGLRQRPPQALPIPPECAACNAELLFYYDYGLWYCPNCRAYSTPRIVAPRR